MHETPVFVVYLDMLFILNFIMDYLIFWMVSKIIYQKISMKRLCFGAGIASVLYCLVVVSPFLRSVNIILYLIILPLIPIQIIFTPKRIKKWIQLYILCNTMAFIIGGISYGMIYWIQEQRIVSNLHKKDYQGFSTWILIGSILLSYVAIRVSAYYMQKRNTESQKLYQIKVIYNNIDINFKALLDTGNRVYDPISKSPVIIAEYKVLEELLPDEIRAGYLNQEDISGIVTNTGNHSFSSRIRLIPYYSLGNPNGILLGFRPDNVYIKADNLDARLIDDVIIAIYQQELSAENTYQGLLHPDLVSVF